MTATERTTRRLRAQGWILARAEQWVPTAGVRRDLFGWIDYVALDPPGGRIIGVQSCAKDFAGHRRKLRGPRREQVRAWLVCGGHALLIGWQKRQGVWTCREDWITVDSLDESAAGESPAWWE